MQGLNLQRRHYEFIAKIIGDMDVSEKERRKISLEFANKLRDANENFNYDRFIEASLYIPLGKGVSNG
tara:strand:- start:1554 stop:1757 length:204 start_codon:yes stop_codon:yes gene_type:complete